VLKIRGPYYAWIAGILGIAGFGLSTQAQNPAAQNQANVVDLSRQQSTNIQPQLQQQSLPLGVNVNELPVTTPGDLDLGVQVLMKRKQEEQPYRFFADAAEFYTNNVALVNSGKQSASYFFADVGFTYQKRLTDELTVEATVRQGFFRYGHFSTFDFDDFNAGTGLTYQVKKLWDIAFFGRYNFERFTNGDIGNDFFRNNTLTVGAQKTFTFHQRDYLYVGYSSIFGWSSPSVNQRDEHGIFEGFHYNFTRNFTGDLYNRTAVFNYNTGRTDFNDTIVASVAYTFNDYAKLTASASFATDTSNHSVFNYNLFTGGGGIALQIKF